MADLTSCKGVGKSQAASAPRNRAQREARTKQFKHGNSCRYDSEATVRDVAFSNEIYANSTRALCTLLLCFSQPL